MDEQRSQAYLSLIQELLTSPGEANDILNRHLDLVDEGFVQVCEQVAAQFQKQGQSNRAGFLQNVAQEVTGFLVSEGTGGNQQAALGQFWLQLLQAERQGGTTAVHQVMRQNMGLIVPALGDTIAQSMQRVMAQYPDDGEDFAGLVEDTCTSIQKFPYGRYAEALEIAIRGYGVVLALGVYTPEKRAVTLNNLGNARVIQAQMGIDPAPNLDAAIKASDAAADIWRRLGLEKDLSGTLNNLGNARVIQAQMGIESTQNLDAAIKAYNAAAEIQRRFRLDKDLSTTLTNLGVACYTQAQMGINLTRNLDAAITAYDEAAEILRRIELEKDLSDTLNNLGNARVIQSQMGIDPAQNLDAAITAYNAAAEIRRRLRLEKDLSDTFTGLGVARYTQADMGIDPAQNLDAAITAYDEAAKIRRRLRLEKDLSTTLNNLGVARVTQAQMGINPAQNLNAAITAYDEAAEIRRRLRLEKDLSTTLNNLGVARRTQAQIGIDPAQNLEGAIAAYAEAAKIRLRLRLEKDLSQTLNNLGNAYSNQAEMGINPASHLDAAITAYDEAAKIRRRLELEKDLSQTLNNLGNARRTQAQMGINPAANLESAIAAYDKAAEIRRRLGLARDLAGTLNNFGFAYQAKSRLPGNSSTQTQQALEKAYQSFQEALDRVEYLRGEIGADSEGYKRNFNEEWNRVYRGMVEVCLELGRYQDAIEYADRSKARNLVELMATRDAYPGGVIPENIRQRLDELKIAIAQAERRLQQGENPDYTDIKQLRQEKQQLEPYKPLHFQGMQELLDEETAILEWYILGDKFLTFTLMPDPPLAPPCQGGEQETPVISAVSEPSQGGESEPPLSRGAGGIQLWTSSEEDLKQLGDWTTNYLTDYYTNKDQWRETLAQRLEALPKILHLDEILQNLRQNFPKCQKLILIPHRYLHLFPLHALPVHLPSSPNPLLPDGEKGANFPTSPLSQPGRGASGEGSEGKFLQDLFPKGVTYAPNCQLLQQAQSRQRRDFNRLFAIQNPTADLAWAEIEVETIRNIFPHRETLTRENARLATFLNKNLSQTHHLFFSCHGSFNPDSPLDSGLLLADGVLTLEEIIAKLNLSECSLVTLSACETGQVALDRTDEYISIASGFILAGSPRVLMSLWSVDEASTALLLIKTYELLQQPGQLALALQAAQKWLRETTNAGFYDWVQKCRLLNDYWRKTLAEIFQNRQNKEGADFPPLRVPLSLGGVLCGWTRRTKNGTGQR
ncbi:CHAT domain-containing protein [[Phormidium] sp. ETS-05]|uniref:CHAT domain-containing protein n=1 Tax=[Phormidium] sp. ETS-05 TaxID=222819 RepID=UPI001E31FB91|nr:CHAT domain-containing protein [[Phormidium] sp. ETS-05]